MRQRGRALHLENRRAEHLKAETAKPGGSDWVILHDNFHLLLVAAFP
jgi:hypothetical protein